VMINDSKNRAMEAKMDSSAGAQAMQIRKQTVEPVFGVLKERLGFRRFSLRGSVKVNGEFNLLCLAYNLKKLAKFLNGHGLESAASLVFNLFIRLYDHLRSVFRINAGLNPAANYRFHFFRIS